MNLEPPRSRRRETRPPRHCGTRTNPKLAAPMHDDLVRRQLPHLPSWRPPFVSPSKNTWAYPFSTKGNDAAYTPISTGRRCQNQLGVTVTMRSLAPMAPAYVGTIEFGMHGIGLCRRTGWHTDPEQLIDTRQDETKQADFVVHTPRRTQTGVRCHDHCIAHILGRP